MAFFRRVQKKVNNLWYPQSVTVLKPVTTREVADELAALSTVSRGDTFAIMENLGRVLSGYMGGGRTVKLDGVGTFYYTAASTKNGVSNKEDVSASQIIGVRVRFIPEVERNSGRQVTTRSMVNTKIAWEEWGKTSSSTTTGTGSGTGDGGDENENPLG
ncbi:HU family DNA-binding protein [Bacteroides helcogenes]|uniref:DNA-binding protein n=1 Tax=Bacteroides helcogenes (strain ATCC 35417 / DSM 20613 / JCM 6297 / CCUG 15421 / P 36-108) TaxID=693979 RepID=E6SQX4_BACT6|nr:HU family DNA-binding protein [Bacteroides helcogenes]ADV45043.1 DNA-binding protein [Bacteroides helcogenes P 36-108]MDY5239901.1 HU family DNA-binding protein [Bacteroides helcogenes]